MFSSAVRAAHCALSWAMGQVSAVDRIRAARGPQVQFQSQQPPFAGLATLYSRPSRCDAAVAAIESLLSQAPVPFPQRPFSLGYKASASVGAGSRLVIVTGSESVRRYG
jgi:hypothetical protein